MVRHYKRKQCIHIGGIGGSQRPPVSVKCINGDWRLGDSTKKPVLNL